jgi:hypothetical protein
MEEIEGILTKAMHVIDTPGHPDYGKFVYTFNQDELFKLCDAISKLQVKRDIARVEEVFNQDRIFLRK